MGLFHLVSVTLGSQLILGLLAGEESLRMVNLGGGEELKDTTVIRLPWSLITHAGTTRKFCFSWALVTVNRSV